MLRDLAVAFHRLPLGPELIASAVVVLLALLVRAVLIRWLRGNEKLRAAERLRWTVQVRNATIAVGMLGLVFIWGAELRDFVVSLVVLASAIVLGTKELLMCFSGSMLRSATGSFQIGDRIEVAGVRGDVIDHGLLGTTILEIGPGHQRTGRTLVIPNSMFLSQAVANDTFTDDYVLHTFEIPVPNGANWERAEERLVRIAHEVADEHTDAAKKHMNAVSARHGLSSFDPTPKVTVSALHDHMVLRVRIPTPSRERGRLEQDITRRFLAIERASRVPARPREEEE
ncbi:MAG: mechanosensitive ion channel family protein [Sandaracinaceae bacterium]